MSSTLYHSSYLLSQVSCKLIHKHFRHAKVPWYHGLWRTSDKQTSHHYGTINFLDVSLRGVQ